MDYMFRHICSSCILVLFASFAHANAAADENTSPLHVEEVNSVATVHSEQPLDWPSGASLLEFKKDGMLLSRLIVPAGYIETVVDDILARVAVKVQTSNATFEIHLFDPASRQSFPIDIDPLHREFAQLEPHITPEMFWNVARIQCVEFKKGTQHCVIGQATHSRTFGHYGALKSMTITVPFTIDMAQNPPKEHFLEQPRGALSIQPGTITIEDEAPPLVPMESIPAAWVRESFTGKEYGQALVDAQKKEDAAWDKLKQEIETVGDDLVAEFDIRRRFFEEHPDFGTDSNAGWFPDWFLLYPEAANDPNLAPSMKRELVLKDLVLKYEEIYRNNALSGSVRDRFLYACWPVHRDEALAKKCWQERDAFVKDLFLKRSNSLAGALHDFSMTKMWSELTNLPLSRFKAGSSPAAGEYYHPYYEWKEPDGNTRKLQWDNVAAGLVLSEADSGRWIKIFTRTPDGWKSFTVPQE